MVRAWCMYDWANSVYALVITSSLFPIYFKSVVVQNGSDIVSFMGWQVKNSILYSYAISFSFLAVAAMLPLLSGMADYSGRKRFFMTAFVVVGSTACMGLYFFKDVNDLIWGIGCAVVASIGYSGSLVFYDAFLPEIVSADRYDSTSAKGYAYGYVGGVTLLMFCLIVIMNAERFGITQSLGTRVSFLLTGIWWLGFAFIPLRQLKDNSRGGFPSGLWLKGYREIRKVWNALAQSPDLKKCLTAFFFFNMGVQSVMYLAQFFGTDVLQLQESVLILIILIIQFVAVAGSLLFSRLSKALGNKRALTILVVIWIAVCLYAYTITRKFEFFALAFVVGMVMGGIQALSRGTYAKLIPRDTKDHASYSSFYDVTFNLSIMFGTFSFGFVNHITGNMRYSVLALAIFFVVGLLLLSTVKSRAFFVS